MAFGKPQRRRPDDDQRVMPLINVVFLLLIFFMVAGQLSKTDSVKIEPPESESAREPGDLRVKLLIAPDGRLLLRGEVIAPADLTAQLTELLDERGDKIVHVKADGAADAAGIIEVLEKIKAAGAEKVHLMAHARSGS